MIQNAKVAIGFKVARINIEVSGGAERGGWDLKGWRVLGGNFGRTEGQKEVFYEENRAPRIVQNSQNKIEIV